MQLLNRHQRPCDTFSFGFAIIILTGFLLEKAFAEYDCSAKDDGWYYDPEFCHVYWRCIHGTSEEFECASGTAWDHHENRCNWLDSVDCSRAEKTTSKLEAGDDDSPDTIEGHPDHVNDIDDPPPTVVVKKRKKKKKKTSKVESNKRMLDNDNTDEPDHTTTSQKKSDSDSVISDSKIVSIIPGTNGKDSSGSSPVIECQPTGIYSVPDPIECNAYYQCDKGIRTKMTCSERHLFDIEKHECNEYEKVFCGTRIINAADKNQCINKRDGIHPDTERDCHFYYQCLAQNKMREAKCAGDQKFSSYTGRCGPPGNAPMPCGSFVPGSSATINRGNIGLFLQIFPILLLIIIF